MRWVSALMKSLEAPRDARPFGSGWISGTLALLASVTGLLLVMLDWYPETFSYPQMAFLNTAQALPLVLRLVLLAGYTLSLLNLMLGKHRALGWTALAISVMASLMATVPPAHSAAGQSVYFGLDYFIVNVLLVGFLFVPIERFFPARPEQTVLREEWREDMFYYLVSSMLVQVLSFLSMAPANFINSTISLEETRATIGALPFWVQVLCIMVATDLVQYWVHRAFHTFPVLWRFHSIHHSTCKLDWLAGARMHFLEIAVLRGLTAVPMFTLGFSAAAIQVYLLVVYFYSSFIHANIGWCFGVIERFFVTPRFHHWHHGSERAAIDINYSTHFPLFDWLFGTHHLPENEWPKAYSVAGGGVPRGYWRQFLHPFRKPEPKPAKPSAKPEA